MSNQNFSFLAWFNFSNGSWGIMIKQIMNQWSWGLSYSLWLRNYVDDDDVNDEYDDIDDADCDNDGDDDDDEYDDDDNYKDWCW